MQMTQEIQVQRLGGKDPLEEEMVAHLYHSYLENSMDSGAWQAKIPGVAELDVTKHAHMHSFIL